MYTGNELSSRIEFHLTRRTNMLKQMMELQAELDTERAVIGMYVQYQENLRVNPDAVFSGSDGLADIEGNSVQQRS